MSTPGRNDGTLPRAASIGAGLLLVLLALPSRGYESDQYSNRLVTITDSTATLDRRVNDALAEIAASWRGPPDPGAFAARVFRELGGLFWVDRIEREATRSPDVDALPQWHGKSIYRGAPLSAVRFTALFGVCRTIRLGGVLVGSDKLGHFFSQGFKYYARHRSGLSDEEILARGRFAERWIFGQLTTGVFSNADLVANYEGYLFYRSLFEDRVVAGQTRLVRWQPEGRATLARPFTWSDHVNDFWDEALNPSHFTPALARWMADTLPTLCPEYRLAPARFVPRDAETLTRRYERTGLQPSARFRLDRVCESGDARAE